MFEITNPHRAEIGVLADAAASGDQAAWDALVDRYAGLVWAVARSHRLRGADADEVFQTTWLRLVEHLGRIADPSRIGGWLATTARRESLRVLRTAGRQIPAGDDLPEPADSAPAPDDALLRDERDRTLRTAFDRLPDTDQRLLTLLTADPMPSYAEIGATLGMPVGSIGPTRARCLRRLRQEAVALALTPG